MLPGLIIIRKSNNLLFSLFVNFKQSNNKNHIEYLLNKFSPYFPFEFICPFNPYFYLLILFLFTLLMQNSTLKHLKRFCLKKVNFMLIFD